MAGMKKGQLTAVDLVRSILAVEASVTPPAAVDALPVCTLELVDAAARLVRQPSRAVLRPLVRTVGTILVSVAEPQKRHARRVVALEGPRAAGWFGAGGFIRAIGAVVFIVANEGGGYTLAVGAFKLFGLALFSRCGEAGGGVNVM